MSLESTIYSRLSGYAGLTALIGQKIYPITIPQDVEFPAITYFVVSETPEHAMGNDAEVIPVRIQVSCWAENYLQAKSVKDQVVAALSRYKTSPVQDIFVENIGDQFEEDTEVYQIVIDLLVFYSTS